MERACIVTFAVLCNLVATGFAQQPTAAMLWRGSMPLTSGIAFTWVQDDGGSIVVNLAGQPTCTNRPDVRPVPLSAMNIQVWLLRADGSALTQGRAPTHINVGNAGCSANDAQYWFAKSAGADPVGLAASINGTFSALPLDTHR